MDAKTGWLYREKLTQAGQVKALFDKFDASLRDNGYLAIGGQIVDASIVPALRQRNTRNENEAVKAGKTPKAWNKKRGKIPHQMCGATAPTVRLASKASLRTRAIAAISITRANAASR
jgi:hypothetical protein